MNSTLQTLPQDVQRLIAADWSPSDIRTWLNNKLNQVEEAQADEWLIRTAADALQPHPPLQYLVDQMLPLGALGIVYGGPGSLKSMVLADLAVCVAGGIRWLDPLDTDMGQPGVSLATTQAKVLWIDLDNGARRTDIRIGAMLRGHGLDQNTPIHYVSMPVPALDASNASIMSNLTKMVIRQEYQLILIDNLGLITGDVEENSAKMAHVMGRLRRLTEDTGATVLLIHHQRKSSGGNEGARKGETLRGHSSIEAALDLALLIERKPGEDAVAIIPTKVRDYMAHDIIGAHFTWEHAEEGRDLWSARFYSKPALKKEEQAMHDLRGVITAICRRQPGIAQNDLVTEVRDQLAAQTGSAPGINRVRGTIKQLVDDGKLRMNFASGQHQYWVL